MRSGSLSPPRFDVRLTLPMSLIAHTVLQMGRGGASDFKLYKLLKMFLDVLAPNL